MSPGKSALIVHGGAGSFPESLRERAKAGCGQALALGVAWLREGRSALDIAEAVVRLLEDDPVYDAGRGSYPTTDGEVEMDAILVDGATLRFGAVAALRNVQHPISVARAVMERTEHCLFVGEGATRFAHDHGFPFYPTEQLRADPEEAPTQGTVGAVVLDVQGHLAAATSTGGTRKKPPGRVGDSPLIGCGAIADDEIGAATVTGHGEPLMRIQMARTVVDRMAAGNVPMVAAEQAVARLQERVHGRGGVICLDPQGRVGFAYNTEHLPLAYVTTAGQEFVGL